MKHCFKWEVTEINTTEYGTKYVEVKSGKYKGLRGYILENQSTLKLKSDKKIVVLFKDLEKIKMTSIAVQPPKPINKSSIGRAPELVPPIFSAASICTGTPDIPDASK